MRQPLKTNRRQKGKASLMRSIHLLIKPASGMCNLNCRYCFYHDIVEKRERKSYGFMTEDTLEAVIQKGLSEAGQDCTIAFQGGEPTLAGLDFYKTVVALEKKHNQKGVRIHHAIQTNGIGLDEAWADFLRENHFLVGISLDGVKETHNCNRVDGRGDGTFSRVMEVIRLLDSRHVEYNVLTVVNRQTAPRATRIYNFYKRMGLGYLQFIPCLDPYGEAPGAMPYSLTAEDYGTFLCTLFDLWYRDVKKGEACSIRQFENYLEMLLGFPPEACGMSGVCGMQHVVEADGSVYPCDFYVLDAYRLGNLRTDSFGQINQRRKEMGFVEASMGIAPECRNCRFFSLCRGGCRRHRPVNQDGTLGRNYFCESYRRFFAYGENRLIELANIAARNLH